MRPPGEIIFLLSQWQNEQQQQKKECESKYKCKIYALQNIKKI